MVVDPAQIVHAAHYIVAGKGGAGGVGRVASPWWFGCGGVGKAKYLEGFEKGRQGDLKGRRGCRCLIGFVVAVRVLRALGWVGCVEGVGCKEGLVEEGGGCGAVSLEPAQMSERNYRYPP